MRNPDYFKYTLAVSFANKSALEMKTRIIQYLGEFARGEFGSLGPEIQLSMDIDATVLQKKSKDVLSRILHQYSQFSISTIDAFFQRVIRSFTRESGLLGNFRLEVENERVLEEVIALMIDELGPGQPQLTDWVIQFSQNRLVEGESWNISAALIQFAKEIFKESYKAIEDDILKVQAKISFPDFLNILEKEKSNFMDNLRHRANEALAILNANKIGVDDFNNKDKGTALKYFREFSRGVYAEAKPRIMEAAESSDWGAKASSKKVLLNQLAQSRLRSILNEMIEFDKKNIIRYRTADLVETNFYSYGLLWKITQKLKEYQAENNIMLLSDASHFLNGVISQSDTPFIYEKVGSFYKHYLIDEFQDTSGLQWNNFKPLVRESLDQNNKSLVVGDVKQSIYRWRGSELGLLQETVEAEIGTHQLEKFALQENWRSAENIVHFNNTFFSAASRQVGASTNHSLPVNAFEDVIQQAVRFKKKGFVKIEFIEKWKGRDEGDGEDQALSKIPGILEDLQSKQIPPGDIAILVRKNWEGQKIADFLMRYKKSEKALPGIRYEVVSNESLRLEAASSVLLLLSALRYLSNPDDAIARGELVFESGDQKEARSGEENEARFSQAGGKSIRGLVPEEFSQHSAWLVKLSLFELTETLIRIFELGKDPKELTYLQSFQDVVLEFGGKDKNDIAAFLKWWDEIKDERSVTVAATSEAVNIFTIHKSKGLQFKYVIVPFCSWLMDHEIPPLLWVKSDQSPYDALGHIAVRYSTKLKTSFFGADYQDEFAKAYLDNLNLLYVAFTRAEEGIMVMAPLPVEKKKEDGKIRDVGQLLYDAIQGSDELRKNFNGTELFSVGQIERLSTPKELDSFSSVRLEKYSSVDWRKRLVIRREGREFFQDEQTYQRQKVNYGILMHTVLSKIHYREEVEEVVQNLNYEGMIIEAEMGPLLEKIKSMMNHTVIGNWYGKEWKVRTETPVILPQGKIARIDRVISREVVVKGQTRRKAIIIDYKTGEKKSADRNQVEEYAGILSVMGYVDVEGYVLYLENLDMVQVMNKMNLNLDF